MDIFEIKTKEEYDAVMASVKNYRLNLYSGKKHPVGTYWKKTYGEIKTRHEGTIPASHSYYHVYLAKDSEPKLLCIDDFHGPTISANRSMVNLQTDDNPNNALKHISQMQFIRDTTQIVSCIGLQWKQIDHELI